MLRHASSSPFQTSSERIERAEAHYYSFCERWIALDKAALHAPVLHIEDDGTGTLRCVPSTTIVPKEFPLLLGEMLYQLRAALDNAVYDAAGIDCDHRSGRIAVKLGFPICFTSKEFTQSAHRIAPLSEKRRAIIEAFQPYNASFTSFERAVVSIERSLSILNSWTEIDRHRTLSVVSSWAIKTDPQVTLPKGVSMRRMAVRRRRSSENEDLIARFRLKGFIKGMNVQVTPNIHHELSVEEPPLPCHSSDTLRNRLNMILLGVKEIVRTLAAC